MHNPFIQLFGIIVYSDSTFSFFLIITIVERLKFIAFSISNKTLAYLFPECFSLKNKLNISLLAFRGNQSLLSFQLFMMWKIKKKMCLWYIFDGIRLFSAKMNFVFLYF